MRAHVLGGSSRRSFDDQAAYIIRLLIDLVDLGGDVGHVLLGDNTVAGRFVELDGNAHRIAIIAFDLQVVDLRERPLDLAVPDDSFFDTSTDVVKKPLVFHIVVPRDLLRGRGR